MRPSTATLCALAACGLLANPVFAQTSPTASGVRPAKLQPRGQAASSANQAKEPGPVQPAAYRAPETIAPGPAAAMPTPDERVYYEGNVGDPIVGGDFGGAACGPGCGPGGGCCGMYVRAEYLLWQMRGMNLPPLVTTSPANTSIANAGIIGLGTTTTLFGGDTVNSDVQSGGRITLGWWFDPCRRLGVEGDYFGLGTQEESFNQQSSGTPILARPFYDVVQGEENATLVAFPNVISGQINASAETTFQGAGVRAIYNLACGDGCGTDYITGCPVKTGYRFDALLGYRYLGLDDTVSIREASTSLDTGTPGSFLIQDLFDTQNSFHGVDLGTNLSWCKGCWSLDLLSKIALGNTRSTINIAGSTAITDDGTQTFTGGVLAQRTNIGLREFDEFAVVPELGFTLGYQINPCWRATLGYTFIYWSRVARAGDAINRNLNPGLLPPEDDPVTTNLRPDFILTYTDFWAQGMTAGLEASW